MHQPVEGECETCDSAPFMWCIVCQARELLVRSVPMKGVYDFWKLAYEIMFNKP